MIIHFYVKTQFAPDVQVAVLAQERKSRDEASRDLQAAQFIQFDDGFKACLLKDQLERRVL